MPQFLFEVECFEADVDRPARGGCAVVWPVNPIEADTEEHALGHIYRIGHNRPAQREPGIYYAYQWPLRVRLVAITEAQITVKTRGKWRKLAGKPPQSWLDEQQAAKDDRDARRDADYRKMGLIR